MKKKFITAKKILTIEKNAISDNINAAVSSSIRKAVKILYKRSEGKIAVMGIGKSGLVARKIAATLSSTGSPSFFTHPSEAIHGDIGMLTKGDSIIVLSHSGEIMEFENLMPLIRKMEIPLISITSKKNSALAGVSNCIIEIKIKKEACPFNYAPTSSTTVMMAVGDAIAILLMQKKKLGEQDLAFLHPGGVLGKRLNMMVKDIMRRGRENPKLRRNRTVSDALFVMTKTRLGAVSIIDANGKITGFFTDGDLRRLIQTDPKPLSKKIEAVMTKKPFTITGNVPAWKAAQIMNKMNFDNIPVVDKCGTLIGIIDERDLLKEGLIA